MQHNGLTSEFGGHSCLAGTSYLSHELGAGDLELLVIYPTRLVCDMPKIGEAAKSYWLGYCFVAGSAIFDSPDGTRASKRHDPCLLQIDEEEQIVGD